MNHQRYLQIRNNILLNFVQQIKKGKKMNTQKCNFACGFVWI
jgi:hypothetical protein